MADPSTPLRTGIEQRYLPPILQEIAGHIGLRATLDLVRWRGGTRVWVPVKYDPDHPMTKAIGHEASAKMVEHYAGVDLDLPKGEIAVKAARDSEIRAQRYTYTQSQLAVMNGLTERQIRNILGPEPADDRQIELL